MNDKDAFVNYWMDRFTPIITRRVEQQLETITETIHNELAVKPEPLLDLDALADDLKDLGLTRSDSDTGHWTWFSKALTDDEDGPRITISMPHSGQIYFNDSTNKAFVNFNSPEWRAILPIVVRHMAHVTEASPSISDEPGPNAPNP